MSQLSASQQKASAAFLKIQKQSVMRDRVHADIADSNAARIANMNKLRELRLARDRQEAEAQAAAASALPRPRRRRAARPS